MVEATRQEVAVLRQLEEATERVELLHARVVQGKAAVAAQRQEEERQGAEAAAALVAAAEGAREQQGAWEQVRWPAAPRPAAGLLACPAWQASRAARGRGMTQGP